MHIVHVHAHIKPAFIDAFIKATIENAQQSLKESGIARFDVLQQNDAPEHFLLIEIYHQPDDQVKHKETAHYTIWRDIVEPMMVEPRTRSVYSPIFP
jgi:quinol monooxygenase YgiN